MRISERERLNPDDAPLWIEPEAIGAGVLSHATEPAGAWIVLKIAGTRSIEPDAACDVGFMLNEHHVAGIMVQLIEGAGRAGMDATKIIAIADKALGLLRDKFRGIG